MGLRHRLSPFLCLCLGLALIQSSSSSWAAKKGPQTNPRCLSSYEDLSRGDLISLPKNETVSFKARLTNGKSVTIPVSASPEIEGKFYFDPMKIDLESDLSNTPAVRSAERERVLGPLSPEDRVRRIILNIFEHTRTHPMSMQSLFFRNRWDTRGVTRKSLGDALGLEPLNLKEGKLYHFGGARKTEQETSINVEAFTEQYKVTDRRAGDFSENQVGIGAQREHSIYYDTPSQWFEKNGIAIREKSWFEAKNGIEPEKRTRRSLFIKFNEKNGDSPFLERNELHFVIDGIEPLSQKDVIAILGQYLTKKIPKAPVSELAPAVELNNFRVGVNIMLYKNLQIRRIKNRLRPGLSWRVLQSDQPAKVGFMVMDSFVSRKPGGEWSKTPVYQTEFELNPKWTNRLAKRSDLFDELIERAKEWLGSEPTREAKFQTALDKAK